MSIIVQQDATVYSLIYFCKLLYMFRVVTPHQSSGAHVTVITASGTGQLRKIQCVKSAKDERYGPVYATFRDRTIAGGSRDGYICVRVPFIFSWFHTLDFPTLTSARCCN